MKTEFLFATPLIVVEPFRRQADVARLADTIRARSREDAGVTHSNDGGWQSGHDFLQWAGDEGKALAHALQQVANKASLDFSTGQLTRDSLKWKVTAWANINGKGMGNHAHYHPGAFWSACFYADDGGIAGGETLGGALEFNDPRGALPLMYAPRVKMGINGCLTAGLSERFFPKTGQLVVFPSWLHHGVTRYDGDGTRVSVAFNLSL